MLRFSIGILFSVLGLSLTAQADTLGPLDGRSPDPSQQSEMSVEIGYVSGDNFSTLAGRLNYQLSPVLSLYGDFGISELGDGDGNAFGVGVRYFLPKQRLVPQLDVGVRASYHLSSIDSSGFSSPEADLSELAVAIHFGGKEEFYSNGLKWYGVVSYNRLSSEQANSDASESDLGFGGGVYMPLGPGEAYIGLENIDNMFIGIGYRHFLGGASY